MSKLTYPIHFKLRRIINYFLFQTFYRLKYSGTRNIKDYCSIFSFSKAIIEFLGFEMVDSIITKSELLNNNSLVIDVGGETGIWATMVYEKYNSSIYIFEPNPESVKILKDKFKTDKVKIFGYGLGSKNMTAQLSNDGMGSSIYQASPTYAQSKKFDIQIIDIKKVFSDLALDSVDLLKINIEGGEYDLVPRIIETGIINKCKIIRIQFHEWIPDSFAMRRRIVKDLSKTHNIEWSFPLVWESWIRKDIQYEH